MSPLDFREYLLGVWFVSTAALQWKLTETMNRMAMLVFGDHRNAASRDLHIQPEYCRV